MHDIFPSFNSHEVHFAKRRLFFDFDQIAYCDSC